MEPDLSIGDEVTLTVVKPASVADGFGTYENHHVYGTVEVGKTYRVRISGRTLGHYDAIPVDEVGASDGRRRPESEVRSPA
ncbi:hypothetical protein [Halegenticoccus soli]|uniref:hypothetical protein n=1 Tax=Halegenticoccus soli TaxID=1985678 RepID=UPI000C6D049A|nr:hypothetical protein [Halegenticoccus soli]